MAIITVILTTSLLIIIYLYIKYKYSYWQRMRVPGPKPTFPYGNLFQNKQNNFIELLKQFYDEMKGSAPFCGIYIFMMPVIILLDIELIKNVIITDSAFFNDRGIYYNEKDDPLSGHLFTMEGDKWKNLRKKLTPAFTSSKMKYMYSTVLEVADQLKNTLTNDIIQGNSHVCEMKDLMSRFTTDVIGRCAFGIECNSVKDPSAEFGMITKKVFNEPKYNEFFLNFLNSNRRLGKFFKIKTTSDEVESFFMRIVKETIEIREKNNIKRNDFMDLLIEIKNDEKFNGSYGNQLTLDEIAAQVYVFFLAGYETSSTVMSFALYELAMHQDIQAKTREEIRNVLKAYDGQFNYEAMLNMPYLDQVINETMRKYPVTGIHFRVASNDYKVPGTQYTIPKGMRILIPALEIHRDPEFYPDPDIFDPERFSADAIKARNNITFTPFGKGPRFCIGSRFGMMQVRVGLVTLLLNYELHRCAKTPVPIILTHKSLILSSVDGLWINLKKI